MYDHKNKEANLNQYNQYSLIKTLTMFEYQNLPETIPAFELEKLLQKNGFAFITEVEGKLYAFNGGLGGVQDVYGNPTTININNVALNFNATLNIHDDGVLLRNDDLYLGLLPLFNRYNTMIVENDINLMMVGYNSRMQTLLSATDDKTKKSAEKFIEKLIGGDIGVIGETVIFDGIKIHNSGTTNNNSITALIEFNQYLKGGLNNEIGLKSNFNMKRERLTAGEVDAVSDELHPFIDNMHDCRHNGVQLINEKYGCEIVLDYGSIWNRKNIEMESGLNGEPINLPGGEILPEYSEILSKDSLSRSLTPSLTPSATRSETDATKTEINDNSVNGEPGDPVILHDGEPGEPTDPLLDGEPDNLDTGPDEIIVLPADDINPDGDQETESTDPEPSSTDPEPESKQDASTDPEPGRPDHLTDDVEDDDKEVKK
jgi:hypothetical protein